MGLYFRNSEAADRVFIGPSDRALFIARPSGPLSESGDGVLRVVPSRAVLLGLCLCRWYLMGNWGILLTLLMESCMF